MNKKLMLLLPMLLLVIGCTSPRGEVQNIESESDSLVVDDLIPLLPSPGEFLDLVYGSGIVYHDGMINPIIDPNNFVLYRNQALNFGVYLTDFSYLLLFEKQSEAIKYVYQIQKIAKKLGVEDYFDDDFFNKLLTNLSYPDSLKDISLQQSTLFFNRMNYIGNKDLVFLVSTGSMIEAMYIASQSIDEKNITEEVVKKTIDLAYLLDPFFIQFFLHEPIDNEINVLVEEIKELRNTFTSMAIAQSSKSIREGNKVIVKSDVTHDINEVNIKKMKGLINHVRGKIINQNY
jgi:hypothetical protein